MRIAAVIEQALAPAAFPVWRKDSVFGLRSEDTMAGDWFVLAHLGFFFFLLSCFGWAAWSIWRRTCRPQPHVKLLIEMEEAAANAQLNPRKPPRTIKSDAPWERSADWWKVE